ncbi:hypothetical protein KFE25_011081 [Diacronema lutheri]|uniref:Calcineurin-like phosphoesterase domain-containing protein n=1 Tax=Diacronema lutheri TaxID=2081491 RepID=A0A8J5XLZ3_DIALT|nr:hypothetical protein KFE25_011081 [Diacronema lutheri]
MHRRDRCALPLALGFALFALHVLLSETETTTPLDGRAHAPGGRARAAAGAPAPSLLPDARAGDELRFFVIGDWGAPRERTECKATQRLVARAMELVARRAGPAFVLSLGDAFYLNGVRSEHDGRLDEVFDETFAHAPSLAALPWLSVLGNHDCRGNVSALLRAGSRPRADAPGGSRAFVLPARHWAWAWRGAGDAGGGNGGHDAGRGGGARFAFVDTCSLVCAPGAEAFEEPSVLADVERVLREPARSAARRAALAAAEARWPPSASRPLGLNATLGRQSECRRMPARSRAAPRARDEQLAWLSEQLRAARAARAWSIVAGHSPIRSAGAGHGDYPQLLRALAPRLQAGGAHLYLAGDEHSLQHAHERGVHLLVLGAGGGLNLHPLQPAARAPRVRWAAAALGFASVRLSASRLALSVYTVSRSDGAGSVGRVLDDAGEPHTVRAAHGLVLERRADGSVEEVWR